MKRYCSIGESHLYKYGRDVSFVAQFLIEMPGPGPVEALHLRPAPASSLLCQLQFPTARIRIGGVRAAQEIEIPFTGKHGQMGTILAHQSIYSVVYSSTRTHQSEYVIDQLCWREYRIVDPGRRRPHDLSSFLLLFWRAQHIVSVRWRISGAIQHTAVGGIIRTFDPFRHLQFSPRKRNIV
jgi:hypothetical protein